MTDFYGRVPDSYGHLELEIKTWLKNLIQWSLTNFPQFLLWLSGYNWTPSGSSVIRFYKFQMDTFTTGGRLITPTSRDHRICDVYQNCHFTSFLQVCCLGLSCFLVTSIYLPKYFQHQILLITKFLKAKVSRKVIEKNKIVILDSVNFYSRCLQVSKFCARPFFGKNKRIYSSRDLFYNQAMIKKHVFKKG